MLKLSIRVQLKGMYKKDSFFSGFIFAGKFSLTKKLQNVWPLSTRNQFGDQSLGRDEEDTSTAGSRMLVLFRK